MRLFSKPTYSKMKSMVEAKKNEASKKNRIPAGTFEQCKGCGGSIHKDEWTKNIFVCPLCGYHKLMPAYDRANSIFDKGTFKETDKNMKSVDVLGFEGVASYKDKLEQNVKKTKMNDCIITGTGKINGAKVAIAIMDFRFLGASMGSVVGEKITNITEHATVKKLPLIIFTASGGARMYEGIFSLMQMAKTSGALERHKEANLPYIVVMTHPTTAGVSASFATLGDIIIAEPKALIGFAGPRVIKDTTQAILPEGFQLSEFLVEKGLIDRVVERKDMKDELFNLVSYLTANRNK